MLYIGIDLGTSAVKLLLMNEKGLILNSVSNEYPIYFPEPGYSEQKPEDWMQAIMVGLKELVPEAKRSEVNGISFGGQMHGLVMLDDNDQVIRPAILWNDGRSEAECDYLNRIIGTEKLSKYTANIAFAGFTAPKLLWVKKHEPHHFAKISKIMLPKDYIAYKLSNVFCSDVSDASGTLFFDVENRCWSKEMLSICGIREEQLPKVFESYEVVGNLSAEMAKVLGFSTNVKIIAGAGDNAAAAIGTGCVGEGACNISLGTSGTIFIANNTFEVDQHNALHSFASAEGTYHLMGCILSAASCNKWWMEDILKTKEYTKEQENIYQLAKNSVFFLPYLMGERSPHNDPNAKGAFIGMKMNTTREEMTLAVLEGVAFAIRDSFEVAKSLGIKINKSRICGGGAKSELWKEVIANVLGIEIEELKMEEGPSYGAAILAAVGCNEFADVKTAVDEIVETKAIVIPKQELIDLYNSKYEVYKKLYPALKDVFKEI